MIQVERHAYDVVVIGAGGAGLRAVIEAREAGHSVAVVCKSLFGKAHTVMAEGGCAAAMGNVNSNDNWQAHVGDRTGLELIRTMQQKIVSLQQEDFKEHGDYEAKIKVFAECTITELLKDGEAIAGAFGYWRESGRFILFETPAVVLATGGVGKSFKVTSNSWEYTGDGHALAMRAGATLINMEFIQFHPTGMVWPPSVKGILVTESVRGDGGVLKNSEGKRFMFEYVPDVFRAQYAETEDEADRWYGEPENN